MNVILSCSPLVMPAPHLDGSWHCITPPTSDRPWLVSSDFALAGSNGYGPWPLFSFSIDGSNWFVGTVGTGPEVGTAYPRQIDLSMPSWSSAYCMAWRMYSCRTRWPTAGLLKFGCAYWMP